VNNTKNDASDSYEMKTFKCKVAINGIAPHDEIGADKSSHQRDCSLLKIVRSTWRFD
jgi:hypothetical protein